MRKFIEFFIKNTAFTHSLFVVILITAFLAYKHVPKELFPPAELDKF
jgi:HAE1 family hydrophobic/amphiphilic exporter-1